MAACCWCKGAKIRNISHLHQTAALYALVESVPLEVRKCSSSRYLVYKSRFIIIAPDDHDDPDDPDDHDDPEDPTFKTMNASDTNLLLIKVTEVIKVLIYAE